MAVQLVTEAGETLIKDGDKKYRLTEKGLETVVDHGFTSEVVTGNEAKRIANQALIQIEENAGKHSKEQLVELHNMIEHFEAIGAEPTRVNRIKDALHAAAELEHAGSAEEIEAILKKTPLAAKFMGEGAKKNLEGFKVDVSAVEKKLAEATAKVEKVKQLNVKLEEMMKGDKPSAEAVNKFIQDNIEHIEDLKPSEEAVSNLRRATKFDFNKAKSGIIAEIETQANKAKPLIEELIKAKDTIASKPDAETLKKATEQVTKLEKDLGEIAGHKYGKAIKAKLPENLMKEFNQVHPTMAAKLGAGASASGEKNGWLSKLLNFNHGEEKLAKIANKEGKAVSELGFFSKLNKTKAGFTAAGVVVLGSVVASIGNKGPGEHAERTQSQGQQSAMGVA